MEIAINAIAQAQALKKVLVHLLSIGGKLHGKFQKIVAWGLDLQK